MDSFYSVLQPLFTILAVLILLVQLLVVGVVLFRFRATPSGLVVAGCYAVFAFLIVVSMVLGRLMGAPSPFIEVAISVIDVLFTLLLAVGIGLIPVSLRKLALRG